MRSRFTPDIANLQSIIDVCLTNNPFDIRSLSIVIDKMVEDGLDLDGIYQYYYLFILSLLLFLSLVYSKDILFQGFPDAIQLGAALEQMTQQKLPDGFEKRIASLTTIGVFVQAIRTGSTVDDLTNALNYIGTLGIRPDDETMEYFRIPEDNTPHTRNELIPKRAKLRSLLDIDMPEGFEVDLDMPKRSLSKGEPFFELQQDRYKKHSIALQKSIKGESREDLVNDLDDDNSFYEDKDKSRFNVDEDDDTELVVNDIIVKKKTIVKKTVIAPGITTIKRQDKRSSNQREILKRLSDAYNKK
jgi:hypothetical protein